MAVRLVNTFETYETLCQKRNNYKYQLVDRVANIERNNTEEERLKIQEEASHITINFSSKNQGANRQNGRTEK